MADADRRRTELLKSYTSLRTYSLENRRFGTRAEMRARMSYVQPGRKEFTVVSEQGSGVIRKRVFRKMIKEELDASREEIRVTTAIAPANYTFRLLGEERVEGRSCYLLEAAPKRRGRYMLRGRIWIDAEDFAIVRIDGSPAQSPFFLIRKTTFSHRYGKFGPFWLPVSNRSSSDVMVYGKTEVTVAYTDYEVNGGRHTALDGGINSTGGRTPEEPAGNGADTRFKH